jgi:hypothetical protein
MDLDEETARSLRGCSAHRPCEARQVGLIFISEDPGLVRAMAIAATECSGKAAANVPETRRKFTKDVNIDGTNRRSPLESTKVPKKRTQKASKRGRKMCQEYAKKLKQSERATPKGQILAGCRKTPVKVVIPSEARNLSLEIEDLRDSSSSANKNGGLLGMTGEAGFSASC